MANPLLETWDTPHGLPPFDRVDAEHYLPGVPARDAHAPRRGERHRRQARDPPTFDNTIAALDRSGRDLGRIERLFFNLAASETSADLQAIERDISPQLAAHHSAISMHAKLFARIEAVHDRREELAGRRRGAAPHRARPSRFRPRRRAAVRRPPRCAMRRSSSASRCSRRDSCRTCWPTRPSYRLPLVEERDFAGLPDYVRAAAREAARERGVDAPGIVTLSRSLIVPFLTFSERRDLREQAYKAWTTRGEHDGAHDNRPIAREILALRNEQARLHGHPHYADYALVDRMAGTPDAVARLLEQVWEPAKARAAAERDALAAMAKSQGATHAIEPWDWRYYAEKVRKARYRLDDGQLKPYFSLDRMLAAAFDTAHRLFGLSFVARPDIRAYHPDVRVFEVRGADDQMVGVFLSDNFARPNKRGGAWMNAYRWQSRTDGETLPIIVNNNNFAKGADGAPTLLSADDLRTLFHEFGHGLHGLLSQVTYERLSGTHVLRDFVELPSQLFEHWAFEPAVLKRHALHHATGEPIPDELDRAHQGRRAASTRVSRPSNTRRARCSTWRCTRETDPAGVDITAFERAELERIGMPREILPRHRLPHFGHLFASAGYAAGYYVYLWAEVLDADGYDAFVEAGDPFDPDVAERARKYVYSSGGTLPPAEAYPPLPRPRSARRAAARPARARRSGGARLTPRAARRRRDLQREAIRESGLQLRDPRHHRREVEPGVALQRERARLEIRERHVDRRPGRGHGDDVSRRAGGQRADSRIERAIHPLEARAKAAVTIEEIRHQDPRLGQPRAGARVERQRFQHPDAAFGVVAVDDDEVEAAVGRRDVLVAVRDLDREAPRIVGQLEILAAAVTTAASISTTVSAAFGRFRYRNFGSDAAPRPIRSTLFGHRGERPQQQREHHVARVFELERKGARDAHRALDPVRSEMEIPDAPLLADLDRHGRSGRGRRRQPSTLPAK